MFPIRDVSHGDFVVASSTWVSRRLSRRYPGRRSALVNEWTDRPGGGSTRELGIQFYARGADIPQRKTSDLMAWHRLLARLLACFLACCSAFVPFASLSSRSCSLPGQVGEKDVQLFLWKELSLGLFWFWRWAEEGRVFWRLGVNRWYCCKSISVTHTIAKKIWIYTFLRFNKNTAKVIRNNYFFNAT